MVNQIHYRKLTGYKYEVTRDYTEQINLEGLKLDSVIVSKYELLSLHPDGTLLIRRGYAWDGPSGPTIDTRSFMRGSLVHDALYQLIREGKLSQSFRIVADRALRKDCIEDGMWPWRAWYVYKLVRIFAAWAAWRKKDTVHRERTAP